MKLLEFFTATEPDMLLEAAKDRYAQMVPQQTIMGFYAILQAFPDLDQYLSSEIKEPQRMLDFWNREVSFAVSELKRADRITWYLRYIKVYILRWGALVFVQQLNEATSGWKDHGWRNDQPEMEQILEQFTRQWEKLSKKAMSELRKLQQNTTKFTQDIQKQYEAERAQYHEAYKKAFADKQADNNRNTRSRLTNAEAAWQRSIKMHDAFQSVGADESGEMVDGATHPRGSGAQLMHNNKTKLAHYMGIPDQRIQEFNWGFMFVYPMENMFNIWENEWARKQQRTIPHDDPSWEGAEKIIEFSDGMAWWNLHRSYCNREGKAMGHCGNSYRSERPVEILTLREPADEGWKVNLTFIWNTTNGKIEESKGFNNQKPDPKYHAYILELLKQPWVKGFDQSRSHDPENNFSIDDLDEENQREITELNPRLAGYIDDETWRQKYGDEHEIVYSDGSVWAMYAKDESSPFSEGKSYVYSVAFENEAGRFWKEKLTIDVEAGRRTGLGQVQFMGVYDPETGHGKPAYNDDNLRKIGDALLRIDDIQGMGPSHSGSSKITDLPDDVKEKIYNEKPVLFGAITDEDIRRMEDNGRLIEQYEDGSQLVEGQALEGASDFFVMKPIQTPKGTFWIKDISVRTTANGEIKAMATLDYRSEDKAREPTNEDWAKIADILMLKGVHLFLPDQLMIHGSLKKDDVPEHIMQQIADAKPSMVSFKLWAEKEGVSEDLLKSASRVASFKGLDHMWALRRADIAVGAYKDGWMAMYGDDIKAFLQSHVAGALQDGSPYDIYRRMENGEASIQEMRWFDDYRTTMHEQPVIYDNRKTLDWIQARFETAEESDIGENAATFWVRIDKVLDAVDGQIGNFYVPQKTLLSLPRANIHGDGEE